MKLNFPSSSTSIRYFPISSNGVVCTIKDGGSYCECGDKITIVCKQKGMLLKQIPLKIEDKHEQWNLNCYDSNFHFVYMVHGHSEMVIFDLMTQCDIRVILPKTAKSVSFEHTAIIKDHELNTPPLLKTMRDDHELW